MGQKGCGESKKMATNHKHETESFEIEREVTFDGDASVGGRPSGGAIWVPTHMHSISNSGFSHA